MTAQNAKYLQLLRCGIDDVERFQGYGAVPMTAKDGAERAGADAGPDDDLIGRYLPVLNRLGMIRRPPIQIVVLGAQLKLRVTVKSSIDFFVCTRQNFFV